MGATMNKEYAHDIYNDMIDDLSVQTLVMDIKQAMKLGMSLNEVKVNIESFEDNADTELTDEEREALFVVLS